MGRAKSDPPESASVWRDLSRMEAELIDPEEQETTAYNRPQLLEMLRRARQKQAEQEAPEISVAEVDTQAPAKKQDEEEVTAPASLPSQHRPSSVPPSVRRSESSTAWLLIVFLAVLLAMVAVMFL